ncbi:MAG: NYN domain-containing protein, partial [Anaerovoracaceae bacterium]
ETERTFSVLDCAVMVISGIDGVQSHTETLWRLLDSYKIPVFIFVNKMDLEVREASAVAAALKKDLGNTVVRFDVKKGSEKSMAASEDELTMASEMLTAAALENGKITDDDIAGAIAVCEVTPCFFGSALRMDGVDELLRGISRYAREKKYRSEFGARVFKIARDAGARLTFMKITGGGLSPKSYLSGTDRSGEEWTEKADQIRMYSGEKYTLAEKAMPGEVAAVTGLTRTYPGMGLGFEKDTEAVHEPFLTYTVIPGSGAGDREVLEALKQLTEEDPELNCSWNSRTGEISVSLMGRIQLEVIRQTMKDRFGLDISFGEKRVIYRETITRTVEGIAHFEPIRHYAEVHVILEPGERGSGVVVSSACPDEILDRDTQKKILRDLAEKRHIGVLTGSPLTDVHIKLVSGRVGKHTEPQDLNEASSRAVRNGLMNTESVLLEPWSSFELKVKSEYSGRIMTDITSLGGVISETGVEDDRTRVTGRAPAPLLSEYSKKIPEIVGDNAVFSMTPDGFDAAGDAEKIIEEKAYDPERDTDEPADSVFFINGKSVIVKWNEIDDLIRMPRVLKDRDEGFDEEKYEQDMERERRFRENLATDDELMAIFERTYGAVKRRNFNEKKPRKPDRQLGSAASKNVEKAARSVDFSAGKRETYLFVDGYNLIHAWPELEELSQRDYGAARDELVDRLCNYQGFTGYSVVVVFDAYRRKGAGESKEKKCNVEVVYTKENETADAYIERATREVTAGAKVKPVVRVVTSDALVQSVAMGHGALRVSSREFVAEIRDVEDVIFNYGSGGVFGED